MEASGSLSSGPTSSSTPKLSSSSKATNRSEEEGRDQSNEAGPSSQIDTKKAAWSKRRSITVPEGDNRWHKSNAKK